ncbi:MAG: protein N-terminal glutamine amidohydrolase [Gammaproteobacteria bacterium]|nr:protein N-terminal glutamine amidohydrolase [Gammaproteobacteria bacterium]
MKIHHKSDYLYTPLFCEENIWQLANTMVNQGTDPRALNVLFLSSPAKKIAIFNQLAAEHAEAVIWDYHMILQAVINHQLYIFDFDSRLNFPELETDYFLKSFPAERFIPRDMQAVIRIIPAASYLRCFYSDRSHMHGIIEHTAYPPYPVISPKDGNTAIKLADYWDMEKPLNDGSCIIFPEN